MGVKAIISGIRYDHRALYTLPKEISLEQAFSRELNGRLYILSSFHQVCISYENNNFKNLEQTFQYKKVKRAENKENKHFIKSNPVPRACKAAAKGVAVDNKWNDDRDEIMKELVEIKSHIPKVKEFLIKTGNKELVEATGDPYGACGSAFRSKKMPKQQNHRQEQTGGNIDGKKSNFGS